MRVKEIASFQEELPAGPENPCKSLLTVPECKPYQSPDTIVSVAGHIGNEVGQGDQSTTPV